MNAVERDIAGSADVENFQWIVLRWGRMRRKGGPVDTLPVPSRLTPPKPRKWCHVWALTESMSFTEQAWASATTGPVADLAYLHDIGCADVGGVTILGSERILVDKMLRAVRFMLSPLLPHSGIGFTSHHTFRVSCPESCSWPAPVLVVSWDGCHPIWHVTVSAVPQGTPGEITDCQRFFAEPQHPISAGTRRYDATSSRHVPPVRSPPSSAVPRGRSACCAGTSVARTAAPSPGRSPARRLECACRRD